LRGIVSITYAHLQEDLDESCPSDTVTAVD
jgi:hypothetical protein